MDPLLQVVESERQRVKTEFLDVQARLGLLKGNTPRVMALRTELKTRQAELQTRLTGLKAQSRQMRGIPERPVIVSTSDEAAASALSAAMDEIKALNERIVQLRHDLHTAHSRISDVEEIRERYESRIEAGQERRRDMVLTLFALLRCEDDPMLSEDEYERRMDAVVRRARTLVSLEKAAIIARGES